MQMTMDRSEKFGMLLMADAAEVRDAADIPEKPDGGFVLGTCADLGLTGEHPQRDQVIGVSGAHEAVAVCRHLQGFDEPFNAAEVQSVVSPLEPLYRGEGMRGDGLDHAFGKRRRIARHSE